MILDSGHAKQPRVIAHLVASPFFGGPERQLLGLAKNLGPDYRTVFLTFGERGLAEPFEQVARRDGFSVTRLAYNAPKYLSCVREISYQLRSLEADVLCCHGYKPDILGLAAARRAQIAAVGVSRGWTGATAKVRLNESLDRACLRLMNQVVCVSAGQAAKVRRAGVPSQKIRVIRNAIDAGRFDEKDPTARDEMLSLFPGEIGRIVVAAGRLSPEKGFSQLIEAAHLLRGRFPGTGFVLFGDGPLRESLTCQISSLGLNDVFVLAGFRADVDRLLPHADVVAIPSFTEGLPNIALEAHAAGLPVVATDVGGIPEVVENGVTGELVSPRDPRSMAEALSKLLSDDALRISMGLHGGERMRRQFTFAAQSRAYQQLFEELLTRSNREKVARGRRTMAPIALVRQKVSI